MGIRDPAPPLTGHARLAQYRLDLPFPHRENCKDSTSHIILPESLAKMRL